MSEYPERFNLAEWLLGDNLSRRADKVAVRSAFRDLTYQQVAEETAQVQATLQELGMTVESRVLVVLPDCPEFVTTWLAIVRGGGVFAMVNPRLPAKAYSYYLEYSRAPVAVVHCSAWSSFEPALQGARFLRNVLVVGDEEGACQSSVPVHHYAKAIPAATAVPAFDSHRDDLAGWLFTSGTSGQPKAAMHFHQDFAWNIDRYAKQVLAMTESDVTLAVSKLFFGYATGTNLMFPFAVGGQTALFPERSTPEAVVENAKRYQPTLLSAVPTTLNGILALDTDSVNAAFAALRLVISAGEALPKELALAFQERFGVEILDGIGSAEMFHIYISNAPGRVRAGSLGQLVPGYRARIVDEAGQEVPVGETGELHVCGGSTAIGYWQARAKSRATFHGDWTRTGDLFRCDAEGYYYYEGRADDLLKVGGIWVAPKEVEDCLRQHAMVAECCVVGKTDRNGLTIPLAFVVTNQSLADPKAAVAELQGFVKSSLAPYKYPRIIEFVDELPRNDRGKIARGVLSQRGQELGHD